MVDELNNGGYPETVVHMKELTFLEVFSLPREDGEKWSIEESTCGTRLVFLKKEDGDNQVFYFEKVHTEEYKDWDYHCHVQFSRKKTGLSGLFTKKTLKNVHAFLS